MTDASTQDSELLRSAVRAALKQLSGSADVRRAMATSRGYEDATWQRLSRELGLPGLTISEEHGGAGLTEAELGIAIEEAGASLLCAPLFATAALAVPLLKALDDEAASARYAPRIAAGELTATVALAEDSGRWQPSAVAATARPAGDGAGWLLHGVKNYVVDGATAGLVLVVARVPGEAVPGEAVPGEAVPGETLPGGALPGALPGETLPGGALPGETRPEEAGTAGPLGVFAVEQGAAGLGIEQLVTLDQTRKQARLTLSAVPARSIGPGDATEAIARATAVSRALLAVEQVGGAQHCLDLTVEYAKTRIQFGRPIGSFQAVKQRLAEMLVLVESAKSAAYAAVVAAVGTTAGSTASDGDDLEHVAAIAALTATEAYTYVTAQTVQLHGGIGFTWEHDAHLYFKRARASALLLGTASELTDLIGRQLEAII